MPREREFEAVEFAARAGGLRRPERTLVVSPERAGDFVAEVRARARLRR